VERLSSPSRIFDEIVSTENISEVISNLEKSIDETLPELILLLRMINNEKMFAKFKAVTENINI
jgi:hypothetical protein